MATLLAGAIFGFTGHGVAHAQSTRTYGQTVAHVRPGTAQTPPTIQCPEFCTVYFQVAGYGQGAITIQLQPSVVTATIYPPDGLESPLAEQSAGPSPIIDFDFVLEAAIGQNGYCCDVLENVYGNGTVDEYPRVAYPSY